MKKLSHCRKPTESSLPSNRLKPQIPFDLGIEVDYYHRKRIIVAVYRRAKPYNILSDCFFNTRKIQNARLILNPTNQSIFCTSSVPMSVSSALFCTAAIPNVTDIAMHIFCASRRTCSMTYSLIKRGEKYKHHMMMGGWWWSLALFFGDDVN